jgi:hypothetical protein
MRYSDGLPRRYGGPRDSGLRVVQSVGAEERVSNNEGWAEMTDQLVPSSRVWRKEGKQVIEERASGPIVPIFILGTGHSGTTILYNMIGYHPDVTWFSRYSRPWIRWDAPQDGVFSGLSRICRGIASWSLAETDRALRKVPYPWQKGDSLIRRVIPEPNEVSRIWQRLLPESGSDVAGHAHAIRELLSAHSRFFHLRFIVVKYPRLNRHVDLLRAVYPTSRFLHIVRDGRAVAFSLQQKLMGTRGLRKHEALRQAADRWIETIRQVSTLPTEDVLELRYEDLCADCHGMLRKILEFVGLEVSSFPFDRIPVTLTPTNKRWLATVEPTELQLLEKRLEPSLSRYGYLA